MKQQTFWHDSNSPSAEARLAQIRLALEEPETPHDQSALAYEKFKQAKRDEALSRKRVYDGMAEKVAHDAATPEPERVICHNCNASVAVQEGRLASHPRWPELKLPDLCSASGRTVELNVKNSQQPEPEAAAVGSAKGGMDGAPLCRVGNRINMTHALNWSKGVCSACGWVYPGLLHL